MSDYICDDRNVFEELQAIKNMTDEEFKEYISKLKKKQEENKSDN